MLSLWLLLAAPIGWLLYQRYVVPRRSPLWLVNGPDPKPSQWLTGSLGDIFTGTPGSKPIEFAKRYGGACSRPSAHLIRKASSATAASCISLA